MAPPKTLWDQARGCGVVLLVLGTLIGVCAFSALIYYLVSPEGESMGTVPADGRTPVVVVAQPGDTLHFTLSYEFPLDHWGVNDGPSNDNMVSRYLRASTLRVVTTSSTGTVLETSCPAYNGRIGTESDVFGTRSISDGLTDCVIAVPSAGSFSVVGSVTWAPEIQAREVILDVRKAGPAD